MKLKTLISILSLSTALFVAIDYPCSAAEDSEVEEEIPAKKKKNIAAKEKIFDFAQEDKNFEEFFTLVGKVGKEKSSSSEQEGGEAELKPLSERIHKFTEKFLTESQYDGNFDTEGYGSRTKEHMDKISKNLSEFEAKNIKFHIEEMYTLAKDLKKAFGDLRAKKKDLSSQEKNAIANPT